MSPNKFRKFLKKAFARGAYLIRYIIDKNGNYWPTQEWGKWIEEKDNG